MQPVSGPIYRYNGASLGVGGFPAYYDGAWLINNRGSNTGFWKEVRLRRDNNTMLRVQDWLPYNNAGSATAQQNSLVIGTQFGEDGALYMSRYPVTCCRNNVTATSTAQIVKITFDVYEETAAPTTTVALDPATPGVGRTYSGPVTVKFTSTDAGAADPSLPMAGVDYTEYRVTLNGVPGAWTKNSNPGLSNPFLSNSVTVADQGNYVIEYRGVDRGGNAEETKQATFTIMRPAVVDGVVQAIVPSTLSLSVASPAPIGPFIPGVAQTYTGTATATVTSSWANAQLQVYDPETVEQRPAGQRHVGDPARPAGDAGQRHAGERQQLRDAADGGDLGDPGREHHGERAVQPGDPGQRRAGLGRLRRDAAVRPHDDDPVARSTT